MKHKIELATTKNVLHNISSNKHPHSTECPPLNEHSTPSAMVSNMHPPGINCSPPPGVRVILWLVGIPEKPVSNLSLHLQFFKLQLQRNQYRRIVPFPFQLILFPWACRVPACVLSVLLPFNSHEWPRQNFSLQYQYNFKQTSDENKEKYQLGDYKLIQYQFLQTNITITVWQTVRRIINEILEVKELIFPITALTW